MRRFVLFLSLCLCPLPLFAQRGTANPPTLKKPPCCVSNLPPGAAFSDKSLWQLDSTWTTDAGEKLQLSALNGRVQVLVMFFASCEYACPLLVHEMKKIEAALSHSARERTVFTLIFFDPDRDPPAALSISRHWQ